jgi:transposase
LAAYDVRADHLCGVSYPRQTWEQVLDFLQAVRRQYPHPLRLHIVLDNRGSHKKQEVRDWCAEHGVRWVFWPTYSSYLNRIESRFTALKKFALSGRYFPDHAAQNAAIQNYLRYRATVKLSEKRH